MKNKQLLSRLLNLGFWAIIIYMVALRIPGWKAAFEQQGQKSTVVQVQDLDGNTKNIPPNDGKPSVVIFWATWCGPCKMELAKYQSAINEKTLMPDRIFAVSLGEDPELVRSFAKQNGYTFNILTDTTGAAGNLFKVQATPTSLFIDAQDVIQHVSTGFSLLGVKRARELLK